MRKSVPPFTFSALCDLPETSKKNSKKNRKFFFSIFSFLELLLSPVVEKVVFESFWALDMAPTWAVPGLLGFITTSALYQHHCQPKKSPLV